MLSLDLRLRDSFIKMQEVYSAALEEYMRNKEISVLNELVPVVVKVDYATKCFKIREGGLGARIPYISLLTNDKEYDDSYDIFEYYCKYNKTDELELPTYFGYDATGMLGYLKDLRFDVYQGFLAAVDNYKSIHSYKTNYVVPIVATLEGLVNGALIFDKVRLLGNLKNLCREYPTSFSLEYKRGDLVLRQHNKKRNLNIRQEEINDAIYQLLSDKVPGKVMLFNYIRTGDDMGRYMSKLLYKRVLGTGKKNEFIVTLIDGGK